MSLNHLRVAHKLWGTTMGLLFVLIVVAAFSQYRSAVLAEQAAASVQHREQAIAKAILWRGMTETGTELLLAKFLADSTSIEEFFSKRFADIQKRINTVQKQIEGEVSTDLDRQALAQIEKARAAAIQSLGKAGEARAVGKIEAFVSGEFLPLVGAYLGALDGFVAVQQQQRDAAVLASAESNHEAMLIEIVGAFVVLLLGILLSYSLVRSITRPLRAVVQASQRIGRGDFTQTLNSDRGDEFGDLTRALATMSQNLRALLREVHDGIRSVSHASNEIASGNEDLSARTEQAAASVQETAASMEEITATITQSAETANQVKQVAVDAADAARHGSTVAQQVIVSMQDITSRSNKISEIIGVIDSIAFQTNILALNAAVEAARAGEQGRGFAVVASEVRALAQRSAQAAREIKALINDSTRAVQSGSAQVAEADQAMAQIAEQITKVSSLITEITAAANEQRDGISQVNLAIGQLDQVTQGNAALVEESAAATSALNEQASRLEKAVMAFNIGRSADDRQGTVRQRVEVTPRPEVLALPNGAP